MSAERNFVVDHLGQWQRVSNVQWGRFIRRELSFPQMGHEMQAASLVVKIDRTRRILDVLSVLTWRVMLDERGLFHDANLSRAMSRVALLERQNSTDSLIADANYFWLPSQRQWEQLADMLNVSLLILKLRSVVKVVEMKA